MALLQATYPIAPKGLATNYEETSLPPDFALRFRNRFINAAGGAEKRRGMEKLGASIPGTPSIDALHELVDKNGLATLMASGEGRIYRYRATAATWVTAHDSGFRGVTYNSAQMVDRLIFVNGTSRNVYTKDGRTFEELRAIIDEGQSISPSSTTQLVVSNISALGTLEQRNVAVDDVVFNMTGGGFGMITAVGSATATHTALASQTAGHHYQILDMVELNIIPQDGGGEDDNVAIAGPGTSTTEIFVSGVTNWTTTSIRVGDFIHNTTRSGITQVSAISSSALGLSGGGITGQTAGDSLTFHKSAMPIAERVHIHYGRAYFIDSRDRHLVRISGPDDPTDMTTSFGTIDSITFSFGSQQPTGDIIKTMTSYQRFLVMAGNRFTLLFSGTDPIIDVSANDRDFSPIGLFPQGARSRNALATIGNDAVVVSDDGVQSFSLQNDASNLGQENLSEALKNTMRDLISTTDEDDIFVFHYPKRSWVCFKIGSQIFVYNYSPYFGQSLGSPQAAFSPEPQRGSWSLFDGKFARQKVFFLRQNGTLVCAGDGGNVYTFDGDGVYDDDGESYSTEYQTGWLTLDEPRRSLQVKQGHYIQPTFNIGAAIQYTISAEAPFQTESHDRIVVTAATPSSIGIAIIGSFTIGGSGIFDKKLPLRWRGKEVRLSITTEDTTGPDIISRFTLYINKLGIR